MGQAKAKGSFEQRKASAIERERNLFPDLHKCSHCDSLETDIFLLDIKHIEGMKSAGAAKCKTCFKTSWSLEGTTEAVDEFQTYIESNPI